jgi:hypothetical protein
MGERRDLVTTMLDEHERCELRALYAADDRLRAENEEYLARTAARAEHHEPAGGSPVRETGDAGIVYRDGGSRVLEGAPVPAPDASYANDGFSETQLDLLAQVVAEVHKEFDAAIERAQQQILATVVRMVMPGEFAEQKVHALSDRVALIETQIERRLANAPAPAAAEHGAEIALLKARIAELKRTLEEREERATAIAEAKRQHAGERVEHEALRLSAALAVRDQRIELLEQKLAMLLRFLSLSHDLPKEF